MPFIYTIIGVLVIILIFKVSKRKQKKIDDDNANMYSKKQHDCFRGVKKKREEWSNWFDIDNTKN